MTTSTKPRKCLSNLTPLQAHELDTVRAARMGVDISHFLPDERCKYPSKFCCNKRARKTTGKLHRFCEEHRARAKVNQKRWTNIRRRQEQTSKLIASSLEISAEHPERMDLAKPLLPKLAPLAIAVPTISESDWLGTQVSSTPTNVDARLEEDTPLSETDIDMLTTIVAQCERAGEAMPMEDAWLMTMLHEVEAQIRDHDGAMHWMCTSNSVQV